MALQPCAACGRSVSEAAISCPQCGHPVSRAGVNVVSPPLSPEPAIGPDRENAGIDFSQIEFKRSRRNRGGGFSWFLAKCVILLGVVTAGFLSLSAFAPDAIAPVMNRLVVIVDSSPRKEELASIIHANANSSLVVRGTPIPSMFVTIQDFHVADVIELENDRYLVQAAVRARVSHDGRAIGGSVIDSAEEGGNHQLFDRLRAGVMMTTNLQNVRAGDEFNYPYNFAVRRVKGRLLFLGELD